ncbi:MAG: hypothetical protein D6677_12715 [Calditrichaeota bacterium]|nr:MAG: hypothetical protein D6677_12715 [Calditrichota bacterium]
MTVTEIRAACAPLMNIIVQEISAYGWLYKMTVRPDEDGSLENREELMKTAAELTQKRKRMTRRLYNELLPGAPEEPTLSALIDLLPARDQSQWKKLQTRLKNTYTLLSRHLITDAHPSINQTSGSVSAPSTEQVYKTALMER